MNVLVLNTGSSSLKFHVISTDPGRIARDADACLTLVELERIGGEARVTIQNHGGERQKTTAELRDITATIHHVPAASGQEHSHHRPRIAPGSGIGEV